MSGEKKLNSSKKRRQLEMWSRSEPSTSGTKVRRELLGAFSADERPFRPLALYISTDKGIDFSLHFAPPTFRIYSVFFVIQFTIRLN